MEMVRAGGYESLTIEAIAARAGVGKQTIYRWWPSKGAVAVDALSAELQTPTTWTASGDIRADLIAQIHRITDRLTDPAVGPHLIALTCEALSDPAVAEALYERAVIPSRTAAREFMVRARAAGEVRDDIDLELAVDLIYAPLFYRLLTRAAPVSDIDATALTDAVLRAIQPAPGDGSRG